MKVNVLLVTYNHAKFVNMAFDCILGQITDFKFKIIVSDDCSTDETCVIIKQYELKYPEQIVILPNKQNVGITRNYQRAFKSMLDADYVAVLEGDDVWTDKFRLQKHINFLEKHSECSFVFNRYKVHDLRNQKEWEQPFSSKKEFEYLTSEDLINDNLIGNFSTCTYRVANLARIEDRLFDLVAYDWMINIYQSQFGKIGYLPEVMSTYFLHAAGTWSSKTQKQQMEELIQTIDIYDEFYCGKFHLAFDIHKQRLIRHLEGVSANKNNTDSLLKRLYYKIKRSLTTNFERFYG